MRHFASPGFWACYRRLPADARKLADKNFGLLKADPRHPSLRFKKIGKYRSVRVGLHAGCGIGRMAVPLTGYLSAEGSYEGFDIVPEGVRWCQENITPKYPNFRFQIADVHNDRYHPEGSQKASEYRFPYADGSFDFVFLTSVFTHMLPQDMENYLSEISRILRSGGRCLITFFLLNAESLKLIEMGASDLDFQ